MREIKFRGKRVKIEDPMERWIEGSLIDYTNIRNERVIRIMSRSGYMNDVHPETVGQFTGLKDTNGKEIYEGDIIRFTYNYKKPGYHVTVTNIHIGVIALNKYFQTCIMAGDIEHHIDNCTRNGEVIGNIYDNPELLSNN
ncbi:YopX family protein [Parabacteroides provencensis]|uniref:YopX family protein n=1 Tax=Parabacteroides provencensis TaxID=1944636 RepID=UPI000C1596F2|nr:YopX family protein [Parabacteroides provencensis]